MNRVKTDGLVREIVGLSACFQSVMEASYVMKAARRALAHNHSCILLFMHSWLKGQAYLFLRIFFHKK